MWLPLGRRYSAAERVRLDRLRNEAIVAWIQTVPRDESLARFAAGVDFAYSRDVLRSTKALRDATDTMLMQPAKGATLEAHLAVMKDRSGSASHGCPTRPLRL
jgi:hypothetical protein